MFREDSDTVTVEEGEVYDVIIQDIARQGDGIARILTTADFTLKHMYKIRCEFADNTIYYQSNFQE